MTDTTPTTNENKEKTVVVPEGAELVDDVFYVWETRFGLYSTMTKDGRNMLTGGTKDGVITCLLYTSPSPRDRQKSRMPSSA